METKTILIFGALSVAWFYLLSFCSGLVKGLLQERRRRKSKEESLFVLKNVKDGECIITKKGVHPVRNYKTKQ